MLRTLLNNIILLFCFQVSLAGPIDSMVINKVNDIISTIKKSHAPDRRLIFFEAEIETKAPLSLMVESTSKEAIAELKAQLMKHNIQAMVKSEVLPAKDLQGKIYGIANFSVCNNRFMPNHASEMATQVLLGTPVQILKKERGYYLVRTPDNYLSWTDDMGITKMDSLQFNNWKQEQKLIYISLYGQSYSKTSKKSLPVSDLVAGNILQVSGKEKKFYKVAYPDGRLAYVPVKDAVLYSKWVSMPNPDTKQIINTATSLLGVPYLWGGTSTKGLDCSGFTKMVYFLNGIVLQRDASQQVQYGEEVDILENDTISIAKCLQNLKAGDLLFFAAGRNRRPNPRISHTAIYMGEGNFIQAAGLVRINSFLPSSKGYDDFQTRTLVRARRILTAVGEAGITRVDSHTFYK